MSEIYSCLLICLLACLLACLLVYTTSLLAVDVQTDYCQNSWSYRRSLFFLLIDHFLKRATTTTTTTTKAVPETKKPIGPEKLIEDVHVIKGFLKLPNKGDWSSLTHLSCMQVHLYPVDFVCNEGHCPQHILFSTRAMVTDVTEYKVEYHLKVFNLAKGKYLIR